MTQTRGTFRYANPAPHWYRGNTHIHSTVSDGGLNFVELAALYRSAGYDFLCRTDHWKASHAQADTNHYPLLWLDGIELDGLDETGQMYHIVCLGLLHNLQRGMGLEAAVRSAHEQGALCIMAHPHWCANTLGDAARLGLDGVEIYNHVCRWLNGKGDGAPYWTAAMETNPQSLGFAVDDCHLGPDHPGWNGGWVMVNAPELTQESIMENIRSGNYYSTCGPEFHSITLDGNTLHLQTSGVQFIRLVGPASHGYRVGNFKGELLTEASFTIPADWEYVYVDIEDNQGRRAWTNHLFHAA